MEGCGNFVQLRCRQYKDFPEKSLVIYQNTRCHNTETHSKVVYFSTYQIHIRVNMLSKIVSFYITIPYSFMIIHSNIFSNLAHCERWCSWLRRSASWRKFRVRFPVGSLVVFKWPVPSPHKLALWYTHSLTETNKQEFPWEQIWQTCPTIYPEYQSKDNNSRNYPLSESLWLVLWNLHLS